MFCHVGRLQDIACLQEVIEDCGLPLENSAQARSYLTMQRLLDAAFPPGRRNYWRSYYLSGLGGGAIAALLEWSQRAPSPFSSVLLESYTGAASRVPVAGTAFPHRAEPYNVHILACWTKPSDDDENIAWADSFWRALRPYSRGAVYVNFLGDEGEERVRAAYGGNYERLLEMKRTYDPANMFQLNSNIDPGPRPRVASALAAGVRHGGEQS
jgi:hypothetical protein